MKIQYIKSIMTMLNISLKQYHRLFDDLHTLPLKELAVAHKEVYDTFKRRR